MSSSSSTSSLSTTITSGISGGALDVGSIVSQLMAVEREPLIAMQNNVTQDQAEISDLGTITSQMAALKTAAAALSTDPTSSSLYANQATSSNASVLSATADSTAASGTYSLTVSQLAQAQQLVSAGQTSATTSIGDGTSTTITFDFGTISGGTLTDGTYSGANFTSNGSGTQSIVIDSSNNTLQGIRDAINAANMGVTASIINDGSGTPYRLVLASNSSGAANSIKITTDGANAAVDNLLSNDPAGTQNMSETVSAQNALFTLNGIQITKPSNTVTDALSGVTLNLTDTTTSPIKLTVSHDTSAVSTAITNFVNAYNTLWTTLRTDASYSSGSSLAGNPLLLSLQSQMRNMGDSIISGGSGNVSQLFQIGLTFGQDGTLSIDSSTLNSMLSSNFNDVANLFSSGNGYASQFSGWVTSTGGLAGTIAQIVSSLNSDISNTNSSIDAFNARMTVVQQQYTSEFSSVNALLANMQSTSNYLAQQLTSKSSS